MTKTNLIILNISIISLLVYVASIILDIFNPYMDLETSLSWSLPLFIVTMVYFVVSEIITNRKKQ